MKSQHSAPFVVLVIASTVVTACGGRAAPANGPIPGDASSAARDGSAVAAQPAPPAMAGTPHYDVVLEVPELSVEEIELNVAGLLARVTLDANAANLVAISAGAVAAIDRVRLGLYGTRAEAYLYADLDNVGHIVRRVVKTLDKNPRILARLLQTADSLANVVGNVAHTAVEPGGVVSQTVGVLGNTLSNVTEPDGLLSQTVNQLGQTLQQVVTETGTLVERTLDGTGRLLNERTIASVLDLPVAQEVTNTLGQTVRTVRTTSGGLIEVTVDQAGEVIGTKVQQQGGAGGVVGAVGQTLQNVTPLVTGLLSQVTNTLGQLVQQVVTQDGSLLERTLDATGKVLNTRTLGSVLDLPLVRQGTNDAGQPIRIVRDPIGNLIEATLAPAGNVIGCRVVQRVSM